MTTHTPPSPPAHDGHHAGLQEIHFSATEGHPGRDAVVRRARWVALSTVVLLLLGLGASLAVRHNAQAQLADRAAEASVLHVHVTRPAERSPDARLALPGTVQSLLETQVHARASGYVRSFSHDLGERVRKGELLAVIEIPEIDRQLQEAQANLELARTAFDRWTRLRASDAVSQQELDEKSSAYRQAQAVEQRLREQVGFARVLAPFDGVITRRSVNVGDLVNAGNGGDAQSLFSIARVDRLHAYVNVPQERAPEVRVGDAVEAVRPERPGEVFHGRIVRSAGAIDLATRTLQVEVELPASEGLLPGTYVEVRWTPRGGGAPTLPATSLLIDARGIQVAVVQDGKAHLKKVVPGTYYGSLVAIRDGVGPGDDVIAYPPETLQEGQAVVVEPMPAPADAAPAKP